MNIWKCTNEIIRISYSCTISTKIWEARHEEILGCFRDMVNAFNPIGIRANKDAKIVGHVFCLFAGHFCGLIFVHQTHTTKIMKLYILQIFYVYGNYSYSASLWYLQLLLRISPDFMHFLMQNNVAIAILLLKYFINHQ